MNRQAQELTKVFQLALEIDAHHDTQADALIDWERREITVVIDQSGQTVYSATINLNCRAAEAKTRLIRHELEQLKIAALAGLKGAA